MAIITAACEFMQNAFPAGPLSITNKFHVVEDRNGEHMIFAIDKRGKLCLILKGLDGHNELVNLSTSLALGDASKVTALAVTQSRQYRVHLSFAVSKSNGYDELYVMKPMPAERQAWLEPATLKAALYTGPPNDPSLQDVSIKDILMGNGNDRADAEYPLLYLTVKLASKSTEDIWAITVHNNAASWKRDEGFEMTINPQRIIHWTGYQPRKPFNAVVEQPVPTGARLIASFDNSEGFTDLLVCADTMKWRSAADCFTKSKDPYQEPFAYQPPTGVSFPKNVPLTSPKHVSVAQAGKRISLWTLDQNSLLTYKELLISSKPPKGKVPPPQELSPWIPLLESRSNNEHFASIQNPRVGQKLFILDKNGTNMSMLQQSVETCIWQSPIDVMIPDSDEIREFTSHTISIQVEDESKAPLPDQELLLCCSDASEMIVNGISTRGSVTGTAVKTDGQGSLTVIIPSDGIAAPILTIQEPNGSSSLLGGRTTSIDPIQKFWDRMAQVKTVDDLRNIKLPNGTSFVKADMSNDELSKAVKAIQDLLKARQDFSSRGTEAVSNENHNLVDSQWGAWSWIRSKATEFSEWTVQKTGAVWKVVVNIAGQLWELIVENFPQIAAALQQILRLVSKGLQQLRDLLEEIFPWEDILLTKNALVNITTASIIMGSNVFANLEHKADECFANLCARVRDLKNRSLPKELADVRISKSPSIPTDMDDKKLSSLTKSPRMQFGTYHLHHSGSDNTSGVLGSQSDGETFFDRLYDRLATIWKSMVELAERFGANIKDLFSKQEFDLDVLLAKIGLDLAEDALKVMQKIVTALLASLSDLLLELAYAMNADMNIPVISPLYSKMTNGSRLTILDAVCLLLAIPGTIAYKTCIGPLPKQDAGWQELVKLDAFKGVLDLRSRRNKDQKGLSNVPPPGPLMSSLQTNMMPQALNKTVLPQFELMQPSKMMELEHITRHSSTIKSNQTAEAKGQTIREKSLEGSVNGAAVNKATDFMTTTIRPAMNILILFMPVGSLLNTSWTLAKVTMMGSTNKDGLKQTAEANKTIQKPWYKIVVKLVMWLGQGAAICFPKFKTLKWPLDNFLELTRAAFNDVVFKWKFAIWMLGGIPIAAHLGNQYVGYCADAATGVVQTLVLVAMHIDVYAVQKVSYAWYRCPEEYMNSTAKVAVAAACMFQGKEPWTLGFAWGLTGVGKTWQAIRVSTEMGKGAHQVEAPAVDNTA